MPGEVSFPPSPTEKKMSGIIKQVYYLSSRAPERVLRSLKQCKPNSAHNTEPHLGSHNERCSEFPRNCRKKLRIGHPKTFMFKCIPFSHWAGTFPHPRPSSLLHGQALVSLRLCHPHSRRSLPQLSQNQTLSENHLRRSVFYTCGTPSLSHFIPLKLSGGTE